jgi:hypothetical protein
LDADNIILCKRKVGVKVLERWVGTIIEQDEMCFWLGKYEVAAERLIA